MIRVTGAVAGAMWLAACADPIAPGPDTEAGTIRLLVDASDRLQLPDAPVGSLPVPAGLFMTIPSSPGQPPIAPTVVADRARRLVEDANRILAQCELHLVMESVQVVAVPGYLGTVQGNERGSFGGHPPADVGDPDLFTYHENARLTKETRELFSYGKRYTSKNAIAVFVVEDIGYYIDQQLTPAGGLSFPPVAYHHNDDYPLRNSVLVKLTGRDTNGLPFASGLVAAHEFGHMLLNTGVHAGEFGGLMVGGTLLTSAECASMHANRVRLFGEDAVHDPGPPEVG